MFIRTKSGWFESLATEEGFGMLDPATGKETHFTIIDATEDDIRPGSYRYDGRGPASRCLERCAGEKILEVAL